MSQPNQFTKADQEGRARPAPTNAYMKGTRSRMEPRQKAAIQATQLANRLHRFAMARGDKVEKLAMKAEQVSAAKVVIDKGLPSLQAIEQSNADPLQDLSEEGIVDLAKALILQHPEVIRALNLIPDPAAVPQSGDMSGDKKLTANEWANNTHRQS